MYTARGPSKKTVRSSKLTTPCLSQAVSFSCLFFCWIDPLKARQSSYQVNTSPPTIRPRIHHPQLRKGVAAPGLRAIHAVGRIPEEVEGCREQRGGVLDVDGGDEGEEAVVEEAALEDEVAEGVGEVPDEEEAEGGGGGGGQDGAGGGVGGEDDGEGREEGEDGGLVEEVGREGGCCFGCLVVHRGCVSLVMPA